MATVKEFVRLDLPPQTHAYDAPDISPLEFLQAVYHDKSLPIAIRIEAAHRLLPFTEPRPPCSPSREPRLTIRIPYMSELFQGSGEPEGEPGSADDPTEIDSENLRSPYKTTARAEDIGDFQNLTTMPEPQTFTDPPPDYIPDYSTPPTPDELQAIKAVVDHLRPDLAHLPVPELHLCACGHWLTFPCDCSLVPRDKSKMN
jgi:hypothetical protein